MSDLSHLHFKIDHVWETRIKRAMAREGFETFSEYMRVILKKHILQQEREERHLEERRFASDQNSSGSSLT